MNGLFGGGNGTSDSPFLVEDADDLNAVRNNLSAYYKQVADIDLIEYTNWLPIGIFKGVYNGNYFKIKNLTINKPTENYIGLFSNAYDGSKLLNIFLINCNVTGNERVGGLVGICYNTISRCFVSGTVNGNQYVGGLTGFYSTTSAYESINNCFTDIVVTGNEIVGGLVGYCSSSGWPIITKCYSTGEIIGVSYVGGLIGYASCDISYCFVLVKKIARKTGTSISVGDLTGNSGSGARIQNYSLDSIQFVNANETINSTGRITQTQAKQQATYSDVSWEFGAIWDITEGVTYPFLKVSSNIIKCISTPISQLQIKQMTIKDIIIQE